MKDKGKEVMPPSEVKAPNAPLIIKEIVPKSKETELKPKETEDKTKEAETKPK